MNTAKVPEVHCAHDKMVPIDELKPHPRNPNTHPQRQVELLAKIIREQGWRAPITVSENSGFIVRGHGRLAAAKMLGLKTVPVDAQKYNTEAEEMADLVADNRIAELAVIDSDTLAAILGDLGQTDIDMELTGFDLVALDDLIPVGAGEDPNDAEKEWDGMPEYVQKDAPAFRTIIVHFNDQEGVDKFSALIDPVCERKITPKTKYFWFPEIIIGHEVDKRYVSESE